MRPARAVAGAAAFALAEAAYQTARFGDALGILETLDARDPEVALLQARVLLRVERPREALRLLLELGRPERRALAAERSVLLGLAYGLTHDFDAGLAEIENARSRGSARSIQADALYFAATIHWMRRDNSSAEAALEELRGFPDPNDRARACALLAWIAVGRQDMESHVALLVAALDEFESAGDLANVYHFARALESLASVCREIRLPDISERVWRLAESFAWTESLAQYRATISRAFGWINALEGNTIAAFRAFKEAATIAPSAPYRLLSTLDRAFLAQATGEQSFADDLLTDAVVLAEQIEWEKSVESERIALLVLGHLTAQVDPPAAVSYLSRFRTLQGNARATTLSRDLRIDAFVSLAAGIARAKLGDVKEAERLLADAWSVFSAFSYEWRAALAAHHLFRLTGSTKWREIAKRNVRAYPKSWLYGEIHANTQMLEGGPRLTPGQRQVFDELCKGASTIAIAQRLSRSPHTIRNHISDIFELFGVRSRAELLTLVNKRSGPRKA